MNRQRFSPAFAIAIRKAAAYNPARFGGLQQASAV
jgi:hypothetical protein